MSTTGSRYIITGSSDGCVHIFDLLTGKQAGMIEIDELLADLIPEDEDWRDYICVRDVSWHPKQPIMSTTTFAGELLTLECRSNPPFKEQEMEDQNLSDDSDEQSVGSN